MNPINMPVQMILGIQSVIQAAFNGSIAQIQIAAGETKNNSRTVRMIVVSDEHAVTEEKDKNGKEYLVFAVPKKFGEKIVEVVK